MSCSFSNAGTSRIVSFASNGGQAPTLGSTGATLMVHVKRTADAGVDPFLIDFADDADSLGVRARFLQGSSFRAQLETNAGTQNGAAGDVLDAGRWHAVGLRATSGGTASLWIDGRQVASRSYTVPGGQSTFVRIGGASGNSIDGELVYCRLWTAALTDAEMYRESFSGPAVRTTNLLTALRLLNGATHSAASPGNDWDDRSSTIGSGSSEPFFGGNALTVGGGL